MKRLKGWDGLSILSVFFIGFGVFQILSLLALSTSTIISSTGKTTLAHDPIRVVLVGGFSVLLISSGVNIWLQKSWGWFLSILSATGLIASGFYEFYLVWKHSGILLVYSVIYIGLGSLILWYLNQSYVKKEMIREK